MATLQSKISLELHDYDFHYICFGIVLHVLRGCCVGYLCVCVRACVHVCGPLKDI